MRTGKSPLVDKVSGKLYSESILYNLLDHLMHLMKPYPMRRDGEIPARELVGGPEYTGV
jgi:hypothetical protein